MRILLLALLLFAGPAFAEPDYRAINAAAVRQHILPRLDTLEAATQRLAVTAEAGCTDIEGLRRGWIGAMLAWQGVQHLRFGPSMLFSRHQRFAFWPDPRNSVARQMGELFQAGALPNFVTGSVAVQGLTALERALFDKAEAEKLASEPFRCTWLKAVTANLAMMAREIRADWGAGRGYAEQFIAAKGEIIFYAGPHEATLDLFKALHGAVELVADHKLARPLGKFAREQRPTMAEHWRSRQSGAAVAADIAAARELFEAFAPEVPDRALSAEIGRRLSDLATRTRELDLDAALDDPGKRPMLDKLRADAAALKTLMADKLAPALDIPVGFNALDGD